MNMNTKQKMASKNINNNIEQTDNNLVNDILSESINTSEFNKISNLSEFKSLSLEDKERMFKELEEFKNRLVGNNQLDANSKILQMIKDSSINFEIKNSKVLEQ